MIDLGIVEKRESLQPLLRIYNLARAQNQIAVVALSSGFGLMLPWTERNAVPIISQIQSLSECRFVGFTDSEAALYMKKKNLSQPNLHELTFLTHIFYLAYQVTNQIFLCWRAEFT